MSDFVDPPLPCPFCTADGQAGWVIDDKEGLSFEVSCSRDGECPSPKWREAASGYETNAECAASVIGFWNARGVNPDGWHGRCGKKPKVPVLVFVDPPKETVSGVPHFPWAIARWYQAQWRDVRDGRIYHGVARWRYL